MLVNARYQVLTDKSEAMEGKFIFSTGDGSSKEHFTKAVSDFVRWWEARHKQVPDYFGSILAVSLCVFTPSLIDDDGHTQPTNGLQFYEWKCDWGIPFGHGRNVMNS